ncbi:MAG: ABC transporter permease [Clostridiaceae bacterium]
MTGYIILKSLRKKPYRNIGIVIQLILGSLIMILALSNYRFYQKQYEKDKKIITPNVYRIDLFGKESYEIGSESGLSLPMTNQEVSEKTYSLVASEPGIDKVGVGINRTISCPYDSNDKSGYLKSVSVEVKGCFYNKELTELYITKVKKGIDFKEYFSSTDKDENIVPMLVSEAIESENPIGSIVKIKIPQGGVNRFKIIGVIDEKYTTLDQLYNNNLPDPYGEYYFIAGDLLYNNDDYAYVYASIKDGYKAEDVNKSIQSKVEDTIMVYFYSLEKMAEGDKFYAVSTTAKPLFYGIIVLILSTFGIISTVLSSLLKRKREFGVRIAVGASKKYIMRMIVGEIAFLFISSQIISIIISAVVSFFNEKRVLDLTVLGINFLVILILLIISIIPAFIRIYRMKPVDLIYNRR